MVKVMVVLFIISMGAAVIMGTPIALIFGAFFHAMGETF